VVGPLSKGGGAAHPRALRYLSAAMAGDNTSAHRPERTGRWGAAVKRALQEVSCAPFDSAPLTCTPAPHSISNGVVCQRNPPSHQCGGAELSFARLPRGRCDQQILRRQQRKAYQLKQRQAGAEKPRSPNDIAPVQRMKLPALKGLLAASAQYFRAAVRRTYLRSLRA
jgi:hypothetical protein